MVKISCTDNPDLERHDW